MSAKPKFAVILSGCGVYDGSEIHEAVMTFLAIDRVGGSYQCFAPDGEQKHVVNHLTGKPTTETRNILVESARIARGNILPLGDFRAEDFDIIAFPGGFGAAKNLCSFAEDGPACSVDPDIERIVRDMHIAKKPIIGLCIAPALLTRILGNINVTLGNDPNAGKAVIAMGGTPHTRKHGEVCVDTENRIVSSPCYMLEASVADIAGDAEAAVSAAIGLL